MIVSWNTTNQCNMSCPHCYRDAGEQVTGELTTAEGKKLISQIAEAGFKIMIFSGGEPLLRPDIFELTEHAAATGLRPVFGTNGTLITADCANQLKAAGTQAMGISLDSLNPEKHNRFRGLSHAWEDTVKAMGECRAAGLAFQLHTTVMEWNYNEITEITDFAREQGAIAHHVFFLVPTGRAKEIEAESVAPVDYERLLRRLMDKQQREGFEIKPTCAPQFVRIAQQMGINTRFQRGCLAGLAYCIISPNGLVQPCAYLDIVAGDVRQQDFATIWKQSPVFTVLRTQQYEGKCGQCDYKATCAGCRARAAYYHNGNYMAEDSWCLYHPKFHNKDEQI